MARAPKRHDPDRLFNPDGFRHYRRGYSLVELRWGLVTLGLMAAILAWVLYRGAHPDPALFAALVPPATRGGPASAYLSKPVGGAPHARKPARRGPLPTKLAPAGWKEGSPAHFDAKNVYEKINGRESYYKSFGFTGLSCLLLKHEGSGATIDIELFDQGQPRNALGAYAGERGEGQKDRVVAGGVARLVRNALYLTRGRFYLRAIGSDESPTVKAALRHVETRFVGAKGSAGATLPWAYALLAKVGVETSAISYEKENAFSFDFAKDVYAGRLGAEGPQLFITSTSGDAAAKVLASRFRKGFASYGDAAGKRAPGWTKDQFIGAFSTAVAAGRFVIGVRAAPKLAPARGLLAKLKEAVRAMPNKDAARPPGAAKPAKKSPQGGEY